MLATDSLDRLYTDAAAQDAQPLWTMMDAMVPPQPHAFHPGTVPPVNEFLPPGEQLPAPRRAEPSQAGPKTVLWPPVALHVKDLETSQAVSWPTGRGWVSYGPQRPIRFRALGRGELPWPSMIDTLLGEGFTGIVYVEHEDVLLPRAQGIASAADQLRALLPAAPPEGRTW